jgi:hypothetical protein
LLLLLLLLLQLLLLLRARGACDPCVVAGGRPRKVTAEYVFGFAVDPS